jgi:cellulose synthase/poly-beta-1,6-N-acetylglucosamine synthase-like glycosyltransferase
MHGASTAPRVSVIVPVYNRDQFVGDTIESVLAQTFGAWELIVFDDGSSDRTRDVADRYASGDGRIRVGSGANGGVAAARNRGLSLATSGSEFVIFLDSDDLWEPDALETLVATLDEHPEYVSVYCLARCIDTDGRFLPGDDLEARSRNRRGFRGGHLVALRSREPLTFEDLVYHYWMVTPGTHLLRRSVVERVGDFDPAAAPADDLDLAIRVSRHGRTGFVDRPLLRWRRHDQTLSNTSSRWNAATRLVRTKALTDPANTPSQRDAARRAYRLAVRSLVDETHDALGRRDRRAATRQAVKAVQLYLAYVWASVHPNHFA